MDKYENFVQSAEWSVREEPAVKIFSVDLPSEIIDEVNEYIDTDTIPNNIDYGKYLAGQLKENEKSAQLDFDCSAGVGLQLKDLLDTMATPALQKKSYADCYTVWSNHCYGGDYNPLHEHSTPTYAGLSGFMWLKLPDEMLERQLNRGQHKVNFNTTEGQYDGWNHILWGLGSRSDLYRLKMPAEEYVQPEIGTMWIFPKWLHHQVMPFYGSGERRSLGMNWNVVESQSELEKMMTLTEYSDFVSRIPDDWNRNEIYPVEMGGITIHVKLDDA